MKLYWGFAGALFLGILGLNTGGFGVEFRGIMMLGIVASFGFLGTGGLGKSCRVTGGFTTGGLGRVGFWSDGLGNSGFCAWAL